MSLARSIEAQELEDLLRERAAAHPALVALAEHWALRVHGDVQRMLVQLDELREIVDATASSARTPVARNHAEAAAIAARHADLRDAWRACAEAGLIARSWLDDGRRCFIDDSGYGFEFQRDDAGQLHYQLWIPEEDLP